MLSVWYVCISVSLTAYLHVDETRAPSLCQFVWIAYSFMESFICLTISKTMVHERYVTRVHGMYIQLDADSVRFE